MSDATANTSLMKQWQATLTRASPSYWAIQVLILLLSVLAGAAFVERIDNGQAQPAWAFMLRAALDALTFIGITHVLVRPVLVLRYLGTGVRWREWLALALWLMLVAVVAIGFSLLIDQIRLLDMKTVTAVQFQAGEEQLRMQLEGSKLYAIAWLNTFISYMVWVALYLGGVALRTRRRLQEQLREAQLQQLTLQLNPHFLFNAFNTIRGSIFEDPQRAADLVTQLAELFRFHLSTSARLSQSLAEEWRLCQQYLAIEQARLDERLRVEVDLQPACLAHALPCLALLGLIENAIKHGIAPDPRGGTLVISAAEVEGSEGWQLKVGNSVASGPQARPEGARMGLVNLRERLRLSYGERARLDVLRCGEPARSGAASNAGAAMSDKPWHLVRLHLPRVAA